jgi:hypothetical protein
MQPRNGEIVGPAVAANMDQSRLTRTKVLRPLPDVRISPKGELLVSAYLDTAMDICIV